jgi:4-hydroxy-tetrahydrodipicolinate synthase
MIGPDALRGKLFPAVPVPFTANGQLHAEGQACYVSYLATAPIGGIAVWAHTGRGLRLSEQQRGAVLSSWRDGAPPDWVLIAAAGPEPGCDDFAGLCDSARAMARSAASLGADALLVYPPMALRGRDDRDGRVLDYHAAVAEAGLPLILFHLYDAAGGFDYGPDVLDTLLNRPEVLGIKVATLDSVMTFQDLAARVRLHHGGKVLLTGEDRFLGYSLMSGAEAALVGMGADCAELQAELLGTWRSGDASRFLSLSAAVDDLARHTFCAPIEGYIRRMLWCLVHHGVLPAEAAHDPWGPPLDLAEFEQLGDCLARIARIPGR